MPPIMEIHVAPVGSGQASMSSVVAATVRVAKDRGLKYRVGAMGTSIEGDLGSLLAVARDMHEAAFAGGVPRVITSIRIDDRRDRDLTMDYKVEAVLEKLGDKG